MPEAQRARLLLTRPENRTRRERVPQHGDARMALIPTGADAPDFALSNQDGTTVKKDDFTGRYVLLWWYPKADTPG